MAARWIYMTATDAAEAERIGRALVEERLAACVNILGAMTSIYRWQGAVTTDSEVAFIAKTTAELVDRLTARVVELHSYECPCVVSLPIEGGHAAFLTWIVQETSQTTDN